MTTTNAPRNWYTETRFTADRGKPGSRWERTGDSVDEITARAQYETLKLRPGVDARLVRLEFSQSLLDAEIELPVPVVVAEATGAA